MIRAALVGGTLCLAGIGIAACGDDDSDSESRAGEGAAAPQTEAAQTTTREETKKPAQKGTAIQVAGSQFGEVIWDGRKQAVYLFAKEKGKRSECYGECAKAWPPVLTEGKPQAKSGAKDGLLGTTTRRDGKRQVTYGGHPLYYYDEPRGEIRCHNVDEFGGLWLVVKPNGDAVS